jgi:hypothetical protein
MEVFKPYISHYVCKIVDEFRFRTNGLSLMVSLSMSMSMSIP